MERKKKGRHQEQIIKERVLSHLIKLLESQTNVAIQMKAFDLLLNFDCNSNWFFEFCFF